MQIAGFGQGLSAFVEGNGFRDDCPRVRRDHVTVNECVYQVLVLLFVGEVQSMVGHAVFCLFVERFVLVLGLGVQGVDELFQSTLQT